MRERRGDLFLLSALALFWACRDAWSGAPGAGQPLATEAGVAGGGGGGGPRLDRAYGQLPLYFVENRGQVRGPVDYYVLGQDTGVYFTSSGVSFALTSGEGDEPGAPRRAQEASLRSGPAPG